MNLRVAVVGEVKTFRVAAGAKASPNRARESAEADAKPSDLRMGRLKVR